MWKSYHSPQTLDQAMGWLSEYGDRARIVAGATDLMLELERGQRQGIEALIDLTRIPGLDAIGLDQDGWIHMGPLVTHNHCLAAPLIVEHAFALAKACYEVGSPQIRNRGTIAGNLITASPANDTIPPLMALGAKVKLASTQGERTISLTDFYTGVRKTVMRPDEIVVDIAFPIPPSGSRSTFVKLALRRAQAISIANVAVSLELDGQVVKRIAIALGSVAPTVIQASQAEAYLIGQELNAEASFEAGRLAAVAAQPIDDIRGSEWYRREMVQVCATRALRQLGGGLERQGHPEQPVMLWGAEEPKVQQSLSHPLTHQSGDPIETTINCQKYTFRTGHDKSLLRLLREEAGLTGTKEGCAEGECGACTVFLDGMAVMSCLVPAPRAHHAQIHTVEGLAEDGHLHPIQQAFIEKGAVQCGYCTPGFLMSGAKLLEERPRPNRWEIQQAITGNLCRCTGYYAILSAIERAAEIYAVQGEP